MQEQLQVLEIGAEVIINKGRSLYYELGANILQIGIDTLNWANFILLKLVQVIQAWVTAGIG